jgi:hypothetical protein
MSSDLETTFVRLFDDRAQLGARDMCVRLEGGHAAIRPVGDGLTCILRSAELLNLRDRSARPVQITGPSHRDVARE